MHFRYRYRWHRLKRRLIEVRDLFIAMRVFAKMDTHEGHCGHIWEAKIGRQCPMCNSPIKAR